MLPTFNLKEVFPDLPQLDFKRVVITLFTSILCVFLCVVLSIYFLIQNIFPLNIIFICATFLYLLSIGLLLNRKVKESKVVLYFSVLIQVFGMSFSLGSAVNLKIFCMPISIIPFLIFGKRERLLFNISMVATIVNILLIYSLDRFGLNYNNIYSQSENEFINKVFNFIALFCMLLLTYMFLSLSELGEELLLQNKSILEKQQAELALNNESLITGKNELEKLNRIKDKLLTIISHDLKSPLNNIDAFTELMLNNKLDKEEMMDLLSRFKETSLSTRHLLDNLVKWSGNHIIDPNPVQRQVSVNSLINQSMQNVSYFAKQKKISIVNITDTHHSVFVDSQMMEIIFRNLIQNAIKFSLPGNEIQIYSSEIENRIQIHVEDKGIGIPESIMPLLFTPGNSHTRLGTDLEKGSGIGLLLCKQLVEANNGTISVSSTPSIKTIFTVDLPMNLSTVNTSLA